MQYKIIFFALLIFSFSCTTQKRVAIKPVTVVVANTDAEDVLQGEGEIRRHREISVYRASETIINDLLHIELRLKFDYKQESVIGSAKITLRPHFYPTDTLTLDASEFEISDISIIKNKKAIALKYEYDKKKIKIFLDKVYKNNEEYTVLINYTAFPNRISKGKAWAISDNKGLYFIDSDTDRPQIWTQGETESNSGWFPVIDSPNQKMSQEIYLTVKQEYKTLSNGELVTSLLNDDGTRTDYWKQDKKHAPYLAMIAIGDFEIIKDYWRDIPVFVYVEKGDEKKAKAVFGNTVEMIEFFSRKLRYDYPWDKYHQVVVRDFVSGAMENTGATVFGDFVLNSYNEKQRIENEAIVAHELSHHWFGDLVTCESWANLTLNEAFASYMEYAWIEYKYGKNEADRHIAADEDTYMRESKYKNVNLIRFDYSDRDNLFDGHSYQKGALILHSLRKVVGENAFWQALSVYLKKNEYKTVEIHNLRIAFEEVTGTDLNWFFNQWFLNKGYPTLNFDYNYNSSSKIQNIEIVQIHKYDFAPLYILPVKVDFYFGDSVITKKIIINKDNQEFSFKFNTKPDLVIFDSENSILGKINISKTKKEYIHQLKYSKLYRDKIEAINYLSVNKSELEVKKAFLHLLNSDFWEFKIYAMRYLSFAKSSPLYEEYRLKLIKISKEDSNIEVRNRALNVLKR